VLVAGSCNNSAVLTWPSAAAMTWISTNDQVYDANRSRPDTVQYIRVSTGSNVRTTVTMALHARKPLVPAAHGRRRANASYTHTNYGPRFIPASLRTSPSQACRPINEVMRRQKMRFGEPAVLTAMTDHACSVYAGTNRCPRYALLQRR
jgi:hypothetical protein